MNRWSMSNDEYAGFLKAAFEDAIEEVLSAHEVISKEAQAAILGARTLGRSAVSTAGHAAARRALGSQAHKVIDRRASQLAGQAVAPEVAAAPGVAAAGQVTGQPGWLARQRAKFGPWAGSVGVGGALGSVVPGVGTVGGMAIGGGLSALGRGAARMAGSKPSTKALAETLISSGRIPAGQTEGTLVPYLDDLLKTNPKHWLVRDLAEEQIKWMKPRPLLGAGIAGGGLYGGGKLLFGGEGGGEGGGGSGEGMLGLGGTTAGSIAGGALGGYGAYQGAKMLDMPEWARWALALGGAGAGSQIL